MQNHRTPFRLRATAQLSKLLAAVRRIVGRFSAGQALFVALALPNTRPAVEIQGFHMVESKVEKRTLEMSAKTAEVFKLENLTALNDMQAKVWGEDRTPFLIDGKLGVLDSNTQNFQIHARSRILAPDGYLFETDNILYRAKERTLETEDKVMGQPKSLNENSFLKLTGVGLNIDLNASTYFIPKDVVATQRLSKNAYFNINAKSATIFPTESRANFDGSVNVKSAAVEMQGEKLKMKFRPSENDGPQTPEELELTGGKFTKKKIKALLTNLELTALGLLVKFDPSGEMKSSEAIGSAEGKTSDDVKLKAESLTSTKEDNHNIVLLKKNVEILTGKRVAHCEEANFNMDSGEIYLKGTASVKQGTQLVQGERIRLSTKNSEITVEQAEGVMDRKEMFNK